MDVVGKLSKSQLVSAYGESAASSVLRKMGGREGLVPFADDLAVGDIILTRHAKKFAFLPTVETYQRKIPQFEEGEAASWTHAMLYVGRLHVVESTNIFKIDDFNWGTGIRITPLIHSSPKTEYLVCRHREANSIPDFGLLAQSVALYALMDHAIRRRSYGFDRATAVVLASWPPYLKFLKRLFPNRLDEAIICSEYVLECLAIGGTILTDEWSSVSNDRFFLPADFYNHPDFEHLPMKFIQINH